MVQCHKNASSKQVYQVFSIVINCLNNIGFHQILEIIRKKTPHTEKYLLSTYGEEAMDCCKQPCSKMLLQRNET